MYTFKKDTFLLIDRSFVNFKDCSFKLLDKNNDGISLQLTKDGKNQVIKNIQSREWKHGSDNYLIEFLVDELNGEMFFPFDDSEHELVLDAIWNPTREKKWEFSSI